MAASATQAPPAAAAPAPAAASSTGEPRRNASALLIALVAACAYAAFAHGAVGLPEETRLEVGLAAVSIWAATLWLGGGGLSIRAGRLGWWGLALLAAFAAWCALTLIWSVAPDRTWQATNRAIAYTLAIALAIAAGASAPRAVERFAVGWLVVATAVATYALGGKLFPGINVSGLFDLNHTADVARLRAPLEYWNALALVCVMAIPVAVRIATDATRSGPWRLAALAALFELMTVLGMTYSRGGILAFATTLIVITALGGRRLQGLAALALAGAAIAPVLTIAFTRTGLKANGVALSQRIVDGRALFAMTVICLILLLVAAWYLLRLESRVHWRPEYSRRIWAGLAAVAACGALVGLILMVSARGGPKGVVERTVDSFTDTRSDEVFDPVRLVSTNSGNRWVWWKEAAGAWSDRPLRGWGAGSFPVTHRYYRRDQLSVAQPHNVPLQFLAETGLVGFVLAMGAILALLAAALARVWSAPQGRGRDLGVALFAGALAWLVHGIVDWDWDIPGVTVPALIFLGLLVARPGGAPRRRPAALFHDPESANRGIGGRSLAMGVTALALCAYGASAILPAWSDSKTSAAQEAIGAEPDPAALERAATQAELAARLDPLTVRPLFVGASIAAGRGRLLDARKLLLDAADRQPGNPEVWLRLATLALQLADRDGMVRASQRLIELDPVSGTARVLAIRAQAFLTPPSASATATGTPLTALPPG